MRGNTRFSVVFRPTLGRVAYPTLGRLINPTLGRVLGGIFRGRIFYLLDGSEDFVHDCRHYRISVGFEGFGAPLSERNGKAVHIKGKPIISSVNRGDRREVIPPLSDLVIMMSFSDAENG